MNNVTPTVRSAQPGDAPFLAWAILAATRSHLPGGWFDIVLGTSTPETLRFLEQLLVTPTRSWWHWSRFLVAELQGRPVGALSAFRASEGYPLSGAAMAEASAKFGWSQETQAQMWARGGYLFTCGFEDDEDPWVLENIATVPSERGRGVTAALIERALEEGRRHGAPLAQITFFIGNDSAARAYTRAGFTLLDTRRHADFEKASGAPGLQRARRPL